VPGSGSRLTSWPGLPIAVGLSEPDNGQVPYFARPVADERDALLTFLAMQRSALRAAASGLTGD